MKTKLIIALDTGELEEARNIVNQLKDLVYGFKIGQPLFLSHGILALKMIKEHQSRIFLDLKFFDIPSVIKKAVKIILDYEIDMFTMHILGGKDMLKGVTDYIASMNSDVLSLGVTVLTSMGQEDLKNIGMDKEIESQVLKLAHLAKDAGVKGLVCSARELGFLKEEFGQGFKFVTPGIRLEKASVDDQKRIMLPQEAAQKGADYIVMGRSILNAKDSRGVTEEVLSQI